MEKLFVQIFERKKWIIEQVRHQTKLFDQHLASTLLIDGITPPPWLLQQSHPSEFRKEELISELLSPHTQIPNAYSFYNCSVYGNTTSDLRELQDGLQGGLFTRDTGKEKLSYLSKFPIAGNKSHQNGASEIDPTVMSPQDQRELDVPDNYYDLEESLARLQRSKARQKALELRNSVKSSKNSLQNSKGAEVNQSGLPDSEIQALLSDQVLNKDFVHPHNSSCSTSSAVHSRINKKECSSGSGRIARSMTFGGKLLDVDKSAKSGMPSSIVEGDNGESLEVSKTVNSCVSRSSEQRFIEENRRHSRSQVKGSHSNSDVITRSRISPPDACAHESLKQESFDAVAREKNIAKSMRQATCAESHMEMNGSYGMNEIEAGTSKSMPSSIVEGDNGESLEVSKTVNSCISCSSEQRFIEENRRHSRSQVKGSNSNSDVITRSKISPPDACAHESLKLESFDTVAKEKNIAKSMQQGTCAENHLEMNGSYGMNEIEASTSKSNEDESVSNSGVLKTRYSLCQLNVDHPSRLDEMDACDGRLAENIGTLLHLQQVENSSDRVAEEPHDSGNKLASPNIQVRFDAMVKTAYEMSSTADDMEKVSGLQPSVPSNFINDVDVVSFTVTGSVNPANDAPVKIASDFDDANCDVKSKQLSASLLVHSVDKDIKNGNLGGQESDQNGGLPLEDILLTQKQDTAELNDSGSPINLMQGNVSCLKGFEFFAAQQNEEDANMFNACHGSETSHSKSGTYEVSLQSSPLVQGSAKSQQPLADEAEIVGLFSIDWERKSPDEKEHKLLTEDNSEIGCKEGLNSFRKSLQDTPFHPDANLDLSCQTVGTSKRQSLEPSSAAEIMPIFEGFTCGVSIHSSLVRQGIAKSQQSPADEAEIVGLSSIDWERKSPDGKERQLLTGDKLETRCTEGLTSFGKSPQGTVFHVDANLDLSCQTTVGTPKRKSLELSSAAKIMPVLEGSTVQTVDEQPSLSTDECSFEKFDVQDFTIERAGFFEQLCQSACLHAPLSPLSAVDKLQKVSNKYHSVPNGLLENISLMSTFLTDNGTSEALRANFMNKEVCQGSERWSSSDPLPVSGVQFAGNPNKPYFSPVGKLWDRISLGSGSSKDKGSLNSELPCISEESENIYEVADAPAEDICSDMIPCSLKRMPLAEITEDPNCLPSVSESQNQIIAERYSIDSVNTEISFNGTNRRIKQKTSKIENSRRKHHGKVRDSKPVRRGASGVDRSMDSLQSRSSKAKTSLRKDGPSISGKDSKQGNIVCNVTSFLPLVQQKPAAAPLAGKRDVKVKALEAAEAAKRQAEKREMERKMKKEALMLERARAEQENVRQQELQKRKKEEERKRREADLAKKRLREEEERKEKECKRRRLEEARKNRGDRAKMEEKERNHNEMQESKNELAKQKKVKESVKTEKITCTGAGTTKALESLGQNPSIPPESCQTPRNIGDTVKVTSILHEAMDKEQLVSRGTIEKSYEISPYQCSDDDEEEDEVPNSKFIPSWASKSHIAMVVCSQGSKDPEAIFPPDSFCSISEVVLPRKFQQS